MKRHEVKLANPDSWSEIVPNRQDVLVGECSVKYEYVTARSLSYSLTTTLLVKLQSQKELQHKSLNILPFEGLMTPADFAFS